MEKGRQRLADAQPVLHLFLPKSLSLYIHTMCQYGPFIRTPENFRTLQGKPFQKDDRALLYQMALNYLVTSDNQRPGPECNEIYQTLRRNFVVRIQ